MKVIIAGSRTITDIAVLNEALKLAKETGMDLDNGSITEIVSGGAAGVDRLGEQMAIARRIPIKKFIPDWAKHGLAAGPIRNKEMVDYADGLIAIWDGKSRGTLSTIQYAQEKGIKLCVYTPSGGSK